MSKHITIYLRKADSRTEKLHGTVISETTTGFFATYEGNPVGEWFATNSPRCICIPNWAV